MSFLCPSAQVRVGHSEHLLPRLAGNRFQAVRDSASEGFGFVVGLRIVGLRVFGVLSAWGVKA